MRSVLLVAFLAAGCATTSETPVTPLPPEPVDPAEPPPETADETFNREVDECFATYRQCQKSGQPESVCFPPQEKCVVKAYRKLKKSRGE